MTTLIIVESPTKSKKIAGYLGEEYKVMASVGHIRDLPANEMGVAPPNFKPEYVTSPKSKEVIARLKGAAAKADMVYLATDPDREGEAIAWHLLDVLKPKNFKRVKFNAITKNAITTAISNAGEIDMALVAAQEARRTLDRLVGYSVSPLLKQLTGGISALSAGRVQTPAVLMVVNIEKAIAAFKPMDHYKLKVHFPWPEKSMTWSATWQHKALQKALQVEETQFFTDKNFINQIAAGLVQQNAFLVYRAEGKETYRNPPSPFSTSLLQQVANTKLGFGVDATMASAQKLFENGLITYHRTDSLNLEEEAAEEIRQFLRENGVAVPEVRNTWASKENAQEAHEAIRPTSIPLRTQTEFPPESNEGQLYKLIWERTIASQMEPAKYFSVTAILVSALKVSGQNLQFIARGKTLLSEGWLKLAPDDDVDEDEAESSAGEDSNASLPPLNEGDRLTCLKGEPLTSTTQPPKRLTIASLVRQLEKNGIGRPSTYANIISNIMKRGYIELKAKKIYATTLGITISDLLSTRFSFASLEFTRKMEGGLDKIAAGELSYLKVVSHQHAILSEELSSVANAKDLVEIKKNLVGAFGEQIPCTKCGTGFFVRRKGGAGHYWACSDFQNCKTSCSDMRGKDKKPAPNLDTVRTGSSDKTKIFSEEDCPQCKKFKLVLKVTERGSFWGCNGFPNCKAKYSDLNGRPVLTRQSVPLAGAN